MEVHFKVGFLLTEIFSESSPREFVNEESLFWREKHTQLIHWVVKMSFNSFNVKQKISSRMNCSEKE